MFGTDAAVAPSKPDAILRYANHSRGFAELRLPKGKGPHPLTVIFHGGCWKTGIATQAYMAPLATRWQEQGIASLNVDYREVGDGGGWPGSFEDWHAAGELVRELARKYPVDPTRITLVGHSAGALPAQWLAAASGKDGPVGPRRPLLARNAIVFDGPADLARESAAFDGLCRFSAVAPFMGGTLEEVPGRYAAIGPLTNGPRLKNLMFVQAVLPPPDPIAAEALRASGVCIAAHANPGASHFDVITPGSPPYQAQEPEILRVLRER
jgi:acetyl esterase/lipase